MPFDASGYGEQIAQLLAAHGNGHKLMPLTFEGETPAPLPKLDVSDGVRAGLHVYLGDFDRAHTVAQEMPTAEGSFWHAIVHRREPDAGNSGYWFRRVGRHDIFAELLERARAIAPEQPFGESWDPFRFIDLCEQARRSPGSDLERIAREIQLAEWQLLFDYCARNRR